MSGTTAICVCTRGRPGMFAACLESLLTQEGVDHVIIADNNQWPCVDVERRDDGSVAVVRSAYSGPGRALGAPGCREALVRTPPGRPDVHVVHAPTVGISQARNAALIAAWVLGVEWIAFIDDDETASPRWLAELKGAAERSGASVVQGDVIKLWPGGVTPLWERLPRKRVARRTMSVSTSNVLFKADVPYRIGLLFDERLGLVGGEDTAFFFQIARSGAVMVFEPAAYVYETAPSERATLRWALRSSFSLGVRRALLAEVDPSSRPLRTAVLRSFRSLLRVAASPLFLVAGPKAAARLFFSGLRDAAMAAGCVHALRGGVFEHYRDVTGW